MSNRPQTSLPPAPQSSPARLSPLQLLFHIGKTSRLTGALLRDRRVSPFRKLLFVGSIMVLILALLAPETVGLAVSNLVPFVGPALELPADAALDWVAVAIAGYNLLRVFPPQIVAEHYNRLFNPVRTLPS